MKPKIKIYDNMFSHTPQGSFGCGDLNLPPTHFDWDRSNNKTGDICVITENSFFTVDSINYPVKCGMILEPVSINPDSYAWISKEENYSKFTYVLTHNKDLLSLNERFRPMIFGGCWLTKEQQQIYPKTKNISIIASWKNQTEGHKLRHEVIRRFGDKIDVFGNGYNKIDSVLTAYKDYKYTIVIENERRNGWFTEKLISAMRCGCAPIYWGAPDIGDYFDRAGMDTFSDLDELSFYINRRTEAPMGHDWQINYIRQNFESAVQYCIPEDWLWLNFFKPLNLV